MDLHIKDVSNVIIEGKNRLVSCSVSKGMKCEEVLNKYSRQDIIVYNNYATERTQDNNKVYT